MTKTRQPWDGDDEYTEARIATVERSDNGEVSITREEDWGTLWIGKPPFPVRKGMVARFYGRGDGFPVRGVLIDGQCVRYNTPEEHEAKTQAEHERFQRQVAEQEAKAKAAGFDEKQMRESDAPWPKSIDELMAYIQKLADGPHDYGTSVYATSLAATATFQFMAGHLGLSGMQASCADLDVIRRTRRIDGPFGLVEAHDMLYPQSDVQAKVSKWTTEWLDWAAEQARAKLAEPSEHVHPDVRAHWKSLASHAKESA